MDLRGIAVVAAGVLVGSCSDSPTAPTTLPPPDATAQYRVTFDATWSAATHPVDHPGNAHWSPLIGGTHDVTVSFWSSGGMASPGIEQMAESGSTSPLYEEIMASIVVVAEQQVFRGNEALQSPGSVSLEFEISVDFPLVTLTSMVAPSPDWFVGVSGLSLLENNA